MACKKYITLTNSEPGYNKEAPICPQQKGATLRASMELLDILDSCSTIYRLVGPPSKIAWSQLKAGGILDITKNPSSNHLNQKIYVSNIEVYAYSIPLVETK